VLKNGIFYEERDPFLACKLDWIWWKSQWISWFFERSSFQINMMPYQSLVMSKGSKFGTDLVSFSQLKKIKFYEVLNAV
jgi:hypothetical protein